MPRKKKISDIPLELSERQKQYLSSETATLEGLSISKSVYKQWKKEPLYKWTEHFVHDLEIPFEDIDRDVTKAAALVVAGYSYAEVETALALPSDTILDWQRGDSEACESFSALVEIGEAQRLAETRDDNLEKLSEKQEQMIQLILMGKNNTEIAAELGVCRQTVVSWRQDWDFKEILQREVVLLRESRRAELVLLHKKAYQAMHDLLESKEESIKLKAAVEILKSTR